MFPSWDVAQSPAPDTCISMLVWLVVVSERCQGPAHHQSPAALSSIHAPAGEVTLSPQLASEMWAADSALEVPTEFREFRAFELNIEIRKFVQ